MLTSDFFCYHRSHTLDSVVALQRWNSLIYQYGTLMSLPLLSIGNLMIMEMSHCSPLLSIAKLLAIRTLFGSTHIWGGETVKWFYHAWCWQLEIVTQLQMEVSNRINYVSRHLLYIRENWRIKFDKTIRTIE